MSTTPPIITPPSPRPPVRTLLWCLLVTIAIAPAAWGGSLMFMVAPIEVLAGFFHKPQLSLPLTLALSGLSALLVTAAVIRQGLRQQAPSSNRSLKGWSIGAVVATTLVVAIAIPLKASRDSSTAKALIPRQPVAALEQFWLEEPDRIFIGYDQLFGPSRPLMHYSPVDGSDLRPQFPVRRDFTNPLKVRLPDGTTVVRNEVLAGISSRGIIGTWPLPQEITRTRFADRVYRLDIGISYRGYHVVDRPPDPAGREGRDQDGVHVYELGDGRRFEITYRGGVPDGPFRAFHADGKPWGEATYRKGRLEGPSWLILRNGQKINELEMGSAAQQAMSGDLDKATAALKAQALDQLKAGHPAEALADLTRALVINPNDPVARRARGDAHLALGDLDQAIEDYCHAENIGPENAHEYRLPTHLRSALLARWKKRTSDGNTAGAAADARALLASALWEAEDQLRERRGADALAALALAPDTDTPAEFHALRARAQWMQDQLEVADADCSRALELAAAGKMTTPANQRLFLALTRYERGHVRRWLGRPAEAAEDFAAAQRDLGSSGELRPGYAAVWRYIAGLEAGQTAEARATLVAAPRDNWWPAERDIADFLLGQLNEGEAIQRTGKTNQKMDQQLLYLVAGLQRAAVGNNETAGPYFLKAASQPGGDPAVNEAARRAAAPFAAKAAAARPAPTTPTAQPARPPSPEETLALAAARKFYAEDYAGAEADFTAAINGKPTAYWFARRALCRHLQGNLDGALADYEQAGKLMPVTSELTAAQAHVYRAQGRLAEAEAAYRAALARTLRAYHPLSARLAIWLYLTRCESGASAAAREELATYRQQLAALPRNPRQEVEGEFDLLLIDLMLDPAAETPVNTAARVAPVEQRRGLQLKAAVYGGLARRLAGDEAGALARFRRALAAPPTSDYQYERSLARQAVAPAK